MIKDFSQVGATTQETAISLLNIVPSAHKAEDSGIIWLGMHIKECVDRYLGET